MVMKHSSSSQGLKAVGHRTDTVGLSLGKLREDIHFELGWGGRQRIEIVDENSSLCLAWPQGSFYNVRIGSTFPHKLDDCTGLQKEEVQ